jgi:hypothetical protein
VFESEGVQALLGHHLRILAGNIKFFFLCQTTMGKRRGFGKGLETTLKATSSYFVIFLGGKTCHQRS